MAHVHQDADMPISGLIHRVGMIAKSEVMSKVAQDKTFTDAGFRPPCIGVMHAIAKMQPCSQKEVAEWIGLDPSDLVGVIDLLENAGYVLRQRDPKDRRRQLLSLTPKGATARKKLMKIGKEAMDEILAPLKDEERELLRAMLIRIVEGHLEPGDS